MLTERICWRNGFCGRTIEYRKVIKKKENKLFLYFVEIQKRNILENAEYFLEEERLVVDESKRVGKSVMDKEIFGIEGTFKKLTID